MIIKMLSFLWRETEIDVLLLTGLLVSVLYLFNAEVSLDYFAFWLMAVALIYGIFWMMVVGVLFLVLGSGKLNEGG